MKALLSVLFVILLGDICHGLYLANYTEWDYYDEANFSDYNYGQGKIDFNGLLRQTALGREISDKISESLDAIGQYFQDVGRKAESTFGALARKTVYDADRFGFQVESHVDKKLQTLQPQLEAYATDVQTQVNDTLHEVQRKTIGVVQNIHGQLTQSAGVIRKKTESLIESLGQTMQTQLASFWQSVTKKN